MYYFSFFLIIIDWAVVAPVHDKDIFGGMNTREKRPIRLKMEKILNNEWIHDSPNFYKFMQVHEN